MVEIQMKYEGQLRCAATHGPSGDVLHTDAPKDNMGKGEAFSPTDLVATALGTCMLTTMAISAQRHGIPFEGATAKVGKEMVTSPLRRIGRLVVEISVPMNHSAEDEPAFAPPPLPARCIRACIRTCRFRSLSTGAPTGEGRGGARDQLGILRKLAPESYASFGQEGPRLGCEPDARPVSGSVQPAILKEIGYASVARLRLAVGFEQVLQENFVID